MAHKSIEERIRNVKYVSEDEMANLEKSTVVLDQIGMDALSADISGMIEKGIDPEGISTEEKDNLAEVSRQFNGATPVQIAGSGVTKWSIPLPEAK